MNIAPARGRSPAWTITLALFPLALWLAATMYFGGDVGRWADDYQMLRRNPETGALALPATQLPERPYFMRPVYFFVCHNLITISFGHEWVVHALMAVLHGLVALQLYRVLRRGGAGSLAATAGAVLFMVAPQCHESVFWMAALGNDASLAAYLALALAMLHVVGRPGPLKPAALAWLFVLAFNVPCWNEQAAAAIPALLLLCLAARRDGDPFWQTARRASLATLVCLAAFAAYTTLVIVTTPSGQRGSASSIISAAEVLPRAREIGGAAWSWVGGPHGRDIITGGLIRASQELRTTRGMIMLSLLAITGVAFAARWFARPDDEASGEVEHQPRRMIWLTLFGLCVIVCSLAPIVAVRIQIIESRLCTVPAAGLGVLLACAIDALRRAVAPGARRWTLGAAGAVVAAGAATLAVSMIGLQGLYRDSTRLDRSVVEQLQALMPDPEGGTVFVPLDARAWAGRTGRPAFDRALLPAWSMFWAIGPLTREVFGRSDLGATFFNPWAGLELGPFTADEFRVPGVVPFEGAIFIPEGSTRVPWRQAVPFVIDERGSVTPVRSVWVERPAGDDLFIVPDRVPRDMPALSSFVIVPREAGGAVPLTGWRRGPWAPASELAPVGRRRALGADRPAMEFKLGEAPQRVSVGLPALPVASRLVFRVAPAEPIADGAVRVRCFWESEPGTTLSEVELPASEPGGRGRWMPLVVELGPLPAERPICLEVSRHPGAAASVFITPGLRLADTQDHHGR